MNQALGERKGDLETSLAIGWIGTGKMGAPMARNLLAQGQKVKVADPVEKNRAPLVERGAEVADALDAFAGANLVFSTLPNDQALRDVVFGNEATGTHGLADILAPGAAFVEMSTVSPSCSEAVAKALSEKEILYLRAPLSGSTALAESADLTILASGDEEAWARARPMLEVMSARQFYLGPSEEARFMKLVLNTLVGASSAILSEALALGASGGLSRAAMMEVICESAVASPLFKYKAEALISDDYTPAFTVSQMIKDFTLISDAARQNDVPLLANGLILEIYRSAANAGLDEKDFFSLVKWHQNLSTK